MDKTNSRYEHIVHPFPPLYDDNSRILILGSLPSVKSRSRCFFMDINKTVSGRLWQIYCTIHRKICRMRINILQKKMLYQAGII